MTTISAFTTSIRMMPASASSSSDVAEDGSTNGATAGDDRFGSLLNNLAEDNSGVSNGAATGPGTTAGASVLGRSSCSAEAAAAPQAASGDSQGLSPADSLAALLRAPAGSTQLQSAAAGAAVQPGAGQTNDASAVARQAQASATWLRALGTATAATGSSGQPAQDPSNVTAIDQPTATASPPPVQSPAPVADASFSQKAKGAGASSAQPSADIAAISLDVAMAVSAVAAPVQTAPDIVQRPASGTTAKPGRPTATSAAASDAATNVIAATASLGTGFTVSAADPEPAVAAESSGSSSSTPRDAMAGLSTALSTDPDDEGASDPGVSMPPSTGPNPTEAVSKLTVVAQATHFAPVPSLSPGQQIASAITTTMRTSTPDATADIETPTTGTGSAEATAGPQPTTPVLRTLDLQLEPDGLGSVTVSMRLAGSALALQLDASNAATGQLIEQDKDTLVTALQGSGYTVDAVVVGGGTATAGQAGADLGGMTQQDQSSNANSASPGHSQEGGRNGHDRASAPQDSASATGASASVPSLGRTRGGDLYV